MASSANSIAADPSRERANAPSAPLARLRANFRLPGDDLPPSRHPEERSCGDRRARSLIFRFRLEHNLTDPQHLCRTAAGGFICRALPLRMLFAVRRAGKDGAIGLAVDADRVAFVDGDENGLVQYRIAIGIEQHEVGRPEGCGRSARWFSESATVASATLELPMITLLAGRSSFSTRA